MTTNDDDFWGNHADWPEVPEGTRREPRAGAGKTVSRWWNNVVGGGSTANREHGGSRGHATHPIDLEDEPLSINPSGEHAVVRPNSVDPSTQAVRPTRDRRPAPGVRDASRAETGDPNSDEWDDDWEIETSSQPAPRPGVDPLLARMGGAVIVLTLLVPLVLGIGSGDDNHEPAANAAAVELPTITLLPSNDVVPMSTDTTPSAVTPSTASTEAVESTSATPAPAAVTTVAAPVTTAAPVSAADAAPASTQVLAAGALASGTAERVEQRCAIDYTVVAGDFWIRLADASGIGLAELLDANDATVDTPMYPGSTICLPDGATVPAPPATTTPTTVPATIQAPAPATAAKPVATTPATTVKPVVTYPTPTAAVAQQIIRDVWPDELEDRAIEIAARESNFVATARNSCCYGLFQINWTPHKAWLAGLGITSPEQLFDATNNAYAAYALYMRSGGWSPWT